MAKERIDIRMVAENLAASRERAKALIMAGEVFIDGILITKAGTMINDSAVITLKKPDIPYVSRGGLKLEKALSVFEIDVADKVCIDVGASTGGFTECLLNAGAKKVYAVDVGYGQLAWKLRNDARVVVMERTNARHLEQTDFEESPVFACMDVSFISITKILPALKKIGVQTIASLLKPQFEADKAQVGKKGIVREASVHKEVLLRIQNEAQQAGFYLQGLTFSPITGQNGNIEFLGYFTDEEAAMPMSEAEIRQVVQSAHEILSLGS